MEHILITGKPKIGKTRTAYEGIRIHDLRHTHATLMLKAGVHPQVVLERLGHANIGITLGIYSRVLPGLQEAAAEKFDRIFEGDANKNSDPFVSKMLAKSEELASRPCRIKGRTKTFSRSFSIVY